MISLIPKLALALLCLAATETSPQAAFNVRDYGATGDGRTLDSPAIQRAIDAATAAGGGIVNLPPGQYISGTLLLKDNVTLRLADGAALLGSLTPADYTTIEPFKEGLGMEMGTSFVGATGAHNIAIDGKGTINGQGKLISQKIDTKHYGQRPILLRLVHCQGVKISGVQLRDSGVWGMNLSECSDVSVQNVNIDSHVTAHNDGIDVDSCDGVTITGCNFTTGDDSLCLKATSPAACKNITATNCIISSHLGAIKLGTESVGDFQNITVDHCQIHDTGEGGIKLLSVDGSHLENIHISNITMDNVVMPIFVRLGSRLSTYHPGDKPREIGVLRHVLIENVQAKASDKGRIMPPSGVLITGIPDHDIEDLTLRNITIELAGGGTAQQARAVMPENADKYPEIDRYGNALPAYGLVARHIQGLNIDQLKFVLSGPDLRPAIVVQDAGDLNINGLSIPGSAQAECAIRLESTNKANIAGIHASDISGTTLRVEGAQSKQIFLDATGLGDRPFQTAAGALSDAVILVTHP